MFPHRNLTIGIFFQLMQLSLSRLVDHTCYEQLFQEKSHFNMYITKWVYLNIPARWLFSKKENRSNERLWNFIKYKMDSSTNLLQGWYHELQVYCTIKVIVLSSRLVWLWYIYPFNIVSLSKQYWVTNINNPKST